VKIPAIILAAICPLLFLVSCSSPSPAANSGSTPTSAYTSTYSATSGITTSGTSTEDQAWATARMKVRSGDMSLVVEDITRSQDQITRLAEERLGYVVSSRNWRDGSGVHGTISIRVPAADFTAVMQAVREMALEVTTQSIAGQDVTEEYVDLGAKLQNLQATEQQLLTIMGKAEKIEDVLAVQEQLTGTQGEIGQTKGRMQFLEQTSATSLLNVTLAQSKLEAHLTAEKRVVGTAELIQFQSQVGGGFAPYSYEWDFGDGNTVREVSPEHSYQSTGTYTVSLKITDDRNNTTVTTMSDYIAVQPGWSIGETFHSAWNGFMSFGRVWVNVMVWVGIFSPIWIVGAGAYFGIRYFKRRRKG
jgi:hypothetical protein